MEALDISAQDINFSQNFYFKDLVNPSLVVLQPCSSAFMYSSATAMAFSGGIKNVLAGYSAYFPRYLSGTVIFMRDEILPGNIFNRFDAGLSYVFDIKFATDVHLVPSVQVYYFQQTYNYSNMIFPSMINPVSGSIGGGNTASYPVENLRFLRGDVATAFIYRRSFVGVKYDGLLHYVLSNSQENLSGNFSFILGTTARISQNKLSFFVYDRGRDYLQCGVIFWEKDLFALGLGVNFLDLSFNSMNINFAYNWRSFNLLFGYEFSFAPGHFSHYELGLRFNFACKKSQRHTIICPAYQF